MPYLQASLSLIVNCCVLQSQPSSTVKMAWRAQGMTGSNNIPLGTRRRFGGDPDDGGYDVSEPSGGLSEVNSKRGRSPTRSADIEGASDGFKRRKKRNRWGNSPIPCLPFYSILTVTGDADQNKAAGLMGLPTAIRANMTSEQLEAYTLQSVQQLLMGQPSAAYTHSRHAAFASKRSARSCASTMSSLPMEIARLPHHPSTTMSVVVSTPGNIVIAKDWRTNVTN